MTLIKFRENYPDHGPQITFTELEAESRVYERDEAGYDATMRQHAGWSVMEFKMSDGTAYAAVPVCWFMPGTRHSIGDRLTTRRWKLPYKITCLFSSRFAAAT